MLSVGSLIAKTYQLIVLFIVPTGREGYGL